MSSHPVYGVTGTADKKASSPPDRQAATLHRGDNATTNLNSMNWILPASGDELENRRKPDTAS